MAGDCPTINGTVSISNTGTNDNKNKSPPEGVKLIKNLNLFHR